MEKYSLNRYQRYIGIALFLIFLYVLVYFFYFCSFDIFIFLFCFFFIIYLLFFIFVFFIFWFFVFISILNFSLFFIGLFFRRRISPPSTCVCFNPLYPSSKYLRPHSSYIWHIKSNLIKFCFFLWIFFSFSSSYRLLCLWFITFVFICFNEFLFIFHEQKFMKWIFIEVRL